MIQMTDKVEQTKGGRWRKLLLSACALGGMFYVSWAANQGMTWELMGGVSVVSLAFTSADTLDKALSSDALRSLKSKLPGSKP